MRTWNDYKKHVKEVDPEMGHEISKIEENTEIISAIIKRRNELGLSQRDLAALCSVPQSSIARIESQSSVPKLDTLLKIFDKLGLMISVTPKTAAH